MNLRTALLNQSSTCATMGSAFMGRLLALLATDMPEGTALAAKLALFDGDIGPSGASLPLRLGGGLHALVLSGLAPALAAVYPPHDVDDARFKQTVLAALRDHEAFMLDWIDSPPQTNEVRRSATLIAAAQVIAARHDMPIMLSELGASGGLNLMWDHYALRIGETTFGPSEPTLTLAPNWHGDLPPQSTPRVADRAGVDLNPLNPQDSADLLRMTAYLWADQPERLAMTRAATKIMTAPIARGDAIDWLEHRLNQQVHGQLHMIQHTIAWQYFPAEARARGTTLIEAAGARATPETPLAWVALESDGDNKGHKGAALTLRLWPGDVTLALGRADFHGRWVKWTGAT